MLIIVFSMNCINIYAQTTSDSESNGGTNPSDIDKGNWDTSKPSADNGFFYGTTYPGSFGLKVTIYNKNTGVKVKEPIFFVNDSDDVKYLNAGNKNGEKIYMRYGGYDRLDNKLDDASNLGKWKESSSSTFKYLKFSDLIGGLTSESIEQFLLRNFNSYENLVSELGLNSYTETQLRSFVLIVEPAVTFRDHPGYPNGYYFKIYRNYKANK